MFSLNCTPLKRGPGGSSSLETSLQSVIKTGARAHDSTSAQLMDKSALFVEEDSEIDENVKAGEGPHTARL